MSISDTARTVGMNLNEIGGRWEETATKVGNTLSEAESTLMEAFSLSPDSTNRALAQKMGLPADTKVESLQMLAKVRYEKSLRIYDLLQGVVSNAHQVLMGIIHQIRAR